MSSWNSYNATRVDFQGNNLLGVGHLKFMTPANGYKYYPKEPFDMREVCFKKAEPKQTIWHYDGHSELKKVEAFVL